MNSSLNFRSIDASEFELVWPIWHEAIAAGDTYPYAPDSSLEEARSIWCSSDKAIYVAEADGEVVGTFYIRPNQPELGAHICNAGFIVSRNHGGNGYGTAMGAFALEEALRLGYQAMQFNLVVADNAASMRIWQKLGFQEIGCVPDAFNNPHKGMQDAYILYKKLVA